MQANDTRSQAGHYEPTVRPSHCRSAVGGRLGRHRQPIPEAMSSGGRRSKRCDTDTLEPTPGPVGNRPRNLQPAAGENVHMQFFIADRPCFRHETSSPRRDVYGPSPTRQREPAISVRQSVGNFLDRRLPTIGHEV